MTNSCINYLWKRNCSYRANLDNTIISADKNYISNELANELQTTKNITLIVPPRSNQNRQLNNYEKWVLKRRYKVEHVNKRAKQYSAQAPRTTSLFSDKVRIVNEKKVRNFRQVIFSVLLCIMFTSKLVISDPLLNTIDFDYIRTGIQL